MCWPISFCDGNTIQQTYRQYFCSRYRRSILMCVFVLARSNIPARHRRVCTLYPGKKTQSIPTCKTIMSSRLCTANRTHSPPHICNCQHCLYPTQKTANSFNCVRCVTHAHLLMDRLSCERHGPQTDNNRRARFENIFELKVFYSGIINQQHARPCAHDAPSKFN